VKNFESMSRQRLRRKSFEMRNAELMEKYGYNLPRRVRRRIAWDSLRMTASEIRRNVNNPRSRKVNSVGPALLTNASSRVRVGAK